MKTNLEKLLEYCIDRKKEYDNPVAYCEQEYYDSCKAKSNLLEEIIGEIKSMENTI